MTLDTKNLKRQKLRNNEYYSIQNLFDELYAKSKSNCNFYNLYDYIISDENILLAYRNIKKNNGSITQGVDNRNIKYLAKLTNEQLISLVKGKLNNYQPQKVRRVFIPKPNGKKRPLGIPTITDRLVQQCILQIMEPICEAKFYNHSYGFRPLISTKHAISRAYHLAQIANLHYVVDVDIKGFFDNINHSKLLKQIWSLGIRDKRLISIISKLLKAPIENEGIPTKGTPQGGIISPLLANITLNEYDWWINSQWEGMITKYNYSKQNKKIRALKQSSKLKEVYIVRYADDFKLFCRNYEDAKKIFVATKMWLKERLGLEISTEKSKIVNLRKNYSEFLGIKMKVHKKRVDNKSKSKYVVKSHIGNKAFERIITTIKEHVKKIQKPKTNGLIEVNLYNSFVLGVHNYFNCATNCSLDFSSISFRTRKSFYNRLHLKKKSGKVLPKYIDKSYGKSKQIKFVYDSPIVPIGYCSHSKLMNFSQKTIYKAKDREDIHNKQKAVDITDLKYLMENPIKNMSVEYNDNRISLFVGQLGKCYITQKPLDIYNMHCHHKKPKHLGGTDEYRNLVLLNKEVHILVHSIKKETIDKYISKLNLTKSMIDKVNKLRKTAKLDNICL